MIIKTKRFEIKKLKLSDVNKKYFSWFNDPIVKKYILFKPNNLSELKNDINKKLKKKDSLLFGIFHKKKHLGNIFLDKIDIYKKKATIGILIGDKNWRGRKVGYEVINELVQWIGNKKKINNFFLGVNKKNIQAINLYKKLNFKIIYKDRENYYMNLDISLPSKIVLGSVQFYSPYGITNYLKKKVSQTEIKKILYFCKNNNIHEIDTSYHYPLNLNYLPKLKNSKWAINTKIPLDEKFINLKYLTNYIKKKFVKKNFSKVNILYIHEDVEKDNKVFKKIYKNFVALKRKKIINKVGISIYNFKTAKELVKKYKIDSIQLPYNALDRRFHFYQKFFLKNKIEIYARSVFLQGVLISKDNLGKLKTLKNKFNLLFDRNKISSINYCLNFVNQNKNIQKMIIGFQNLNQISEIFNGFKYSKISEKIKLRLKLREKKLIDPRNW